MKRYLTFALIALIGGTIISISNFVVTGQEPVESKPSAQHFNALMRMKLDRSKGMLEGLSMEDYPLIANNARALKLLSMESGWNVIQSKEYQQQSNEFRRACDLIVTSAEEQDVHRAALGYVALTIRCVECHSYVRRNVVSKTETPTIGDNQ